MSFRDLAKKGIFYLNFAGFLLLVFTLSAALTVWFYLKHEVQGKVVVIPELFSKTEIEARQLCTRMGLILRVDSSQKVFSPIVEKGGVLLQIPRPGRKIKAGREVDITLSAGPQKKLVPQMEGETISFSQTLLTEAGMRVRVLSRAPSSEQSKGRVLAQIPLSGSELALRQGTSLLISDGEQLPWYVTPNLVGKEYLAVKTFLDSHEIRVITKYRQEVEDLGRTVLEQTPKAGYPINKLQTITLVVNKDF